MSDTTDAYAAALFEIAKAEGNLETVEDELFKVARTVEANDDLRSTLLRRRHADRAPGQPWSRRCSAAGCRRSPPPWCRSWWLPGGPRNLPEIIDKLVAQAAEERHEAVAEVRTAYPLDDDPHPAARRRPRSGYRQARVGQGDRRPLGLGGVVARIGDTVIDGSIRHRLDQLRESLSLYRPL